MSNENGTIEIEGDDTFVEKHLGMLEKFNKKKEKSDNRYTNQSELDVRIALLRYFSSGSGSHVSHLLTLAIGFFAVITAYHYIPSFNWGILEITPLITVCILSAFVVLGIYMMARLIYYGSISGYVVHIPSAIDADVIKNRALDNPLDILYYASIEKFEKDHGRLRYFAGSGFAGKFPKKNIIWKTYLMYAVFWVIPVIFYLVLYVIIPNWF